MIHFLATLGMAWIGLSVLGWLVSLVLSIIEKCWETILKIMAWGIALLMTLTIGAGIYWVGTHHFETAQERALDQAYKDAGAVEVSP